MSRGSRSCGGRLGGKSSVMARLVWRFKTSSVALGQVEIAMNMHLFARERFTGLDLKTLVQIKSLFHKQSIVIIYTSLVWYIFYHELALIPQGRGLYANLTGSVRSGWAK